MFLARPHASSLRHLCLFMVRFHLPTERTFFEETSLINKYICSICLAVAAIIVVLIFVVMMVFSGFLVELANVFSFLRWIQWVSAFRYAANVLTINEFRNTRFCFTNYTNLCPSGNSILQEESIDYTSNWDMWKYLIFLTVMAVVSFILAYVRLLLIKKIK